METSEKIEKTNLMRLAVKDLGFPGGAITDEIYKRSEDLGLELCEAEAGPYLRLQYSGHDWMLIAMKQISDRDGGPSVFDLGWFGEQLELDAGDADPGHRWDAVNEFVFRLRKLETEKV